MDETIVTDLRYWNVVGIIVPVLTMAAAARIEKVPSGKLLIEMGDAVHILHPIWRGVRVASLIASAAWCVFFSWGIISVGIFVSAFLASWLPGLLGWYDFIVLRSRLLDIVAVIAAAIVWVGTAFAAVT